jgi:hypothetical protein
VASWPRLVAPPGTFAFVLVAVVACGEEPSSFEVETVRGGISDASAAPPFFPSGNTPRCPGFTAPPNGTSCTSIVQPTMFNSCEYGHDLAAECNVVVTCDNFVWTQRPAPACYGRCPSARADIVPGTACTGVGRGCSYVEGTCGCVADPDAGAEDAGANDAGANDAGANDAGAATRSGTWRCVAPPAGRSCPRQRPAIGSDCVRPVVCDYGSEALGIELTFACEAESWQRVPRSRAGEASP